MARNRVIYQSEVVLAGSSPATGFHLQVRGNASNQWTGVPSSTYADITGHLNSANAIIAQTGNKVQQLHRVQSANYSFNFSREDVYQYGELGYLDRVINATPTVTLDINYLLANFANEQTLGFLIDNTTSAITNIINKTEDERNYFIKTVGEGVDAIGGGVPSGAEFIGIGNGFLSSYSSEASVGNFPSVNVSVEGLNIGFFVGSSGQNIPAINPQDGTIATSVGGDGVTRNITFDSPEATSNISGLSTDVADISVLRPGDIDFYIEKTAGGGTYDALGPQIQSADAKLQSYNISFDLSRTPLEKLGSKYAYSREIDFPVAISLTTDFLVDTIQTGSLINRLDCDDQYDVTITINSPDSCNSTTDIPILKYIIKNLTLDSQSFSSSIGDNKSVTLEFSSSLSGPNQTGIGLFMSGIGFDQSLS